MKTAPVILTLILGCWRPEDLIQTARFLDADELTRAQIDCELWVKLTAEGGTDQTKEDEENCKFTPVSGFELN